MSSSLKLTLFGLLVLLTSGCSSVSYYLQAIGGHLDILASEQPIEELIAQPETDTELRRRLSLAKQARVFASQQLGLPDNDSYKTYVDLGRPYVVWTVVATPPFSIQPREWCFYFVGCLSYRGYFSREDARELAEDLKQQGMDVSVGGTMAYSTLGYFDDPLVSSMLRYDDISLVGVIFHELAHQLIHVENDTAFNEAFATAVEQEGVRRWLIQQNKVEAYQAYTQRSRNRHEFFTLVKQLRSDLDVIFRQPFAAQQKVQRKKALYADFKTRYAQWAEQVRDHRFDNWVHRDLNNAHLALIATYHDQVPGFIHLLEQNQGNLQAFYQRVRALGNLPEQTRATIMLACLQECPPIQTQSR